MDGLGRRQLHEDIRKARFVPLLGAGASSLRPDREDLDQFPWSKLLQNLRQVYQRLDHERDRNFVRHLASWQLGLPDLGLTMDLAAGGSSSASRDRRGNYLKDLQASLIRAAAGLTHCLGAYLKDSPCPISGPNRIEIPVDPASPTFASALSDLVFALDLSLELSKQRVTTPPVAYAEQENSRHLLMKPLYMKLLCFVLELRSFDRADPDDPLQSHIPAIETLPHAAIESMPEHGSLKITSLAWLSDLIWYTFRHWIPRYPTTRELAFEVSLRSPEVGDYDLDLARVAQRVEYLDSVPDCLTEVLRACEERQIPENHVSPDSEQLSSAIASILTYQFYLYSKLRLQDPVDRYRRDSPEQREILEVALPIALTTNYDQTLEMAFKRLRVPYHVMFPVYRTSSLPGERHEFHSRTERSSWCLRSYDRGDTEDSKIYADCMLEDEPDPWRLTHHLLQGPLIVKLHGSPLESLPAESVHHLVVMSESSYLGVLRGDLRLPDWIWDALRNSSIWMLGYSLSDVHVRLWFSDQLNGPRVLLRHPHEVEPASWLHWLNVRVIHGDLKSVAAIVAEILAKLGSRQFGTSEHDHNPD